MDLNRRRFLGGAAAFAWISPAAAKDEKAYRFLTADAEIEMAIEFHDGYASRGFWFGEQLSNRNFCLSAVGEEGFDLDHVIIQTAPFQIQHLRREQKAASG